MDGIDILLGVAVLAVIGWAVSRIVIKRKKGETGCGCGCASCPSAVACGGNCPSQAMRKSEEDRLEKEE